MPKDETCYSFFSSFFLFFVCVRFEMWFTDWKYLMRKWWHRTFRRITLTFSFIPFRFIEYVKKCEIAKIHDAQSCGCAHRIGYFRLSFVVWFRIILHSVRKCRSNKISARYLSNNKTRFINFRLSYFECCWNWFGPKERQMTLLHSLCELHLWKAHQNYGYMGRPSTQLFACCLCEQQ